MTNDLITRLESADGPSRELDAAIAVAVSNQPDARVSWMKGRRWFSKPGPSRIAFAGFGGSGVHLGITLTSTRYTASIDAALTLVPEGWDWELYPREAALIHPDIPGADVFADASTPALALAAAALKARGV